MINQKSIFCMSFLFSTHYQSDYFEEVGRRLAVANNSGRVLNSTHPIGNMLGVVINESYGMATIKHCAEVAWQIDQHKLGGIEYVAAIYECTIVGVFKVLDYTTRPSDGRTIFNLDLADKDIQHSYLGRKVDGKLVNGPIIYL